LLEQEMKMTLIDRYIDAVRRKLPRAHRDDIASELREILQTQIEEKEALSRRRLTEDEVRGILKKYGDPYEVARHYGAHQYLIGPSVFPSYVASLKIVLCVFLPIVGLVMLITILTAEEQLAAHLLKAAWTMLGIGLLNLTLITLMFAYFSRTRSTERERDSEELWELESRLMAVPIQPVRRADAIGSIMGLTLFLAWWLGANAVLWRWFGWQPLPFEWTPVWSSVSQIAIPAILAGIVREVMALIRPHWTKVYYGSGLLLDFVGLVMLARLLQAGKYVVPVGEGVGMALSGVVNVFVFVALLGLTLTIAVGTVFGILRILTRSISWNRATV